MKFMIIVYSAIFALSMLSTVLATAQSGSKKPMVVFVTGDHEYSSEATMPLLAKELEQHYGMQVKVLKSYPDYNAEENIPGLEALKDADLLCSFSMEKAAS